LAVLLAGNDPIDQYLLRHPDYFFAQSPEHAVVDPENPYVLANHLKAAAFELPLDDDAVDQFGSLAPLIAEVLCGAEHLQQVAGKFYFAAGQNPATQISLRHMSDNTFSIVLQKRDHASDEASPSALEGGRGQEKHGKRKGHEVIANVDAISAPELVYPEAVYLHHGESYLVRELDLDGKVAYVERRETDYYTQAVLESSVRITSERVRRQLKTDGGPPRALLAFGEVDVSWKTVAFKKIKFNTRENIGFGPVDIPAQNLPTTALWLAPDGEVRTAMRQAGLPVAEGVCGVRNLAVVALPMVAMCDSRDISGVVDSKNLGQIALILYDRYPGGLGYCEKGFQHIDQLLQICHEMVADCQCEDGCPSCVGLPNLRPAIHSDPDLMRGYPIPNKAAAVRLLELLWDRSRGAGGRAAEGGAAEGEGQGARSGALSRRHQCEA
jgi:DEAD/DEAH box helicase domain-containing protein